MAVDYLKKVVPQLVPIIEVLDDKVRRKYADESVAVIDRNDTVHMAHIDIHYGFSVNGVASLHTEILKDNELNHFYKIYPKNSIIKRTELHSEDGCFTAIRSLPKCLILSWVRDTVLMQNSWKS